MSKSKLSRDQKRKKKKLNRREKFGKLVEPYKGRKYQSPTFALALMKAEVGIHEADLLMNRRLTDRQVEKALTYLVLDLQGRKPADPPDDNPVVTAADGLSDDLIASHIRAGWLSHFAVHARHPIADLTGILRTIMESVRTRTSMAGHGRGYLDFIERFLAQIPTDRQSFQGNPVLIFDEEDLNDEDSDDEDDSPLERR